MTLPAPVAATLIPVAAPVTLAAVILRAPPLVCASIPMPPVPDASTRPDASTDTSPVPLETALMPAARPNTAAAVTVREPADDARASIPMPLTPVPVTEPVALISSLFALACLASIPVLPVTVATSTVTEPAADSPEAWMPAVPVPVTVSVALTFTVPEPLLTALIPVPEPVTVAAVTFSAPEPKTMASMPTPVALPMAETKPLA